MLTWFMANGATDSHADDAAPEADDHAETVDRIAAADAHQDERVSERIAEDVVTLREVARATDRVARRLDELARRWDAIEGFPLADQIEGPRR